VFLTRKISACDFFKVLAIDVFSDRTIKGHIYKPLEAHCASRMSLHCSGAVCHPIFTRPDKATLSSFSWPCKYGPLSRIKLCESG
ncbi:hypothetical protein NDU88_005823, partial [Pleurodeles waltl]